MFAKIALAICFTSLLLAEQLPDGVSINLRNPQYCDGVLQTLSGGVVTAPNLRVQAREIESRRENRAYTLYAEGDLMVEYGEHLFTGQSLHYNFHTHRGVIYEGRGMFHPWYVGASCIELLPEGGYRLYRGFLSTSPSWDPEWRIAVERAYLSRANIFTASNVTFQIARLPIMWTPYLKTSLSWILDSPLRYRLRWGGPQGPRFGVSYKLIDQGFFKTFLRVDYRLSRGPGLAIETEACSPTRKEIFLTRNYVARDSAIDDPSERFRYRFQGFYNYCLHDDRMNLNVTYDKVSDEDMPRDYSDEDLELKTAQRTQLCFRGQSDYGIADFRTRIRVNSFETLKEDIPSIGLHLRPLSIGAGILTENRFHFGYHDFRFSNSVAHSLDYSSTRAALYHRLYRPLSLGPICATPQAGLVAIYYGNSADQSSKWVVLGQFGSELTTQLYRHYGSFKHVIEPYLKYDYYTAPQTGVNEHFIFNLDDGWSSLHALRLGSKHLLYQKCESIAKRLHLDLYTYAFFNTPSIGTVAPRLYAETMINASDSLRYTALAIWNLQHHAVDSFNFRTQWTASENLALNVEYRYRSPYYWRRLDPNNFIMDTVRTEADLLKTTISDRRSTLLFHAFYRFKHDIAFEALYHHGWNRVDQPYYRQYQLSLLKTIRSTWHIKLSYQQRENDHRVAVHIKVGLKKPSCHSSTPYSLLE